MARLKPDGDTALLDCLAAAARELIAFKTAKALPDSTRLRIIALTDGEDTSYRWALQELLRSNQVVLDGICINTDESRELLQLCLATGGSAFDRSWSRISCVWRSWKRFCASRFVNMQSQESVRCCAAQCTIRGRGCAQATARRHGLQQVRDNQY